MIEDFQYPILTVDVVILALFDGRLHVLLPPRAKEPFAGVPSLVGGYIHTNEDEDTHGAANRILQEKVLRAVPYLEQLATFSGSKRDPRGWSATVAYISMIRLDPLKDGLLLEDMYPVDNLPDQIGFDHAIIIQWAVERIRNKANYSTLPLLVMPKHFTLTELQRVYEGLMNTKIDTATFRYKIRELDIVEPTGEMSDPKVTKTRPAELYKAAGRKLWLFNNGMK